MICTVKWVSNRSPASLISEKPLQNLYSKLAILFLHAHLSLNSKRNFIASTGGYLYLYGQQNSASSRFFLFFSLTITVAGFYLLCEMVLL